MLLAGLCLLIVFLSYFPLSQNCIQCQIYALHPTGLTFGNIPVPIFKGRHIPVWHCKPLMLSWISPARKRDCFFMTCPKVSKSDFKRCSQYLTSQKVSNGMFNSYKSACIDYRLFVQNYSFVSNLSKLNEFNLTLNARIVALTFLF